MISSSIVKKFTDAQAIIFDMDGVLIDIENINFLAYRRGIFENTKVKISWDYYKQVIAGRRAKDSILILLREHAFQNPEQITSHILKSIYLTKKRLLQDSEETEMVYSGVKELLDKLNYKSIPVALATSTIREFTEIILEKSGLKRYFQNIVCAEDVENGKPNPDVFKTALNQLGNYQPGESLIIEDSIDGVNAAISGGFKYIMVKTNLNKCTKTSGETLSVDCYGQLAQLL